MSQTAHDAVDESNAATELSTDARYELLAVERRRIALAVVADSDGPLTLHELASAVAEREADAPDADDAEAVAISLHHVHLPRIADAGIVTYDTADKRIEQVGDVPTIAA